LTVEFLERVRGTREFESVDLLREQLCVDIEAVWRYVEAHPADVAGTGEVGHPEVS
jgi:hypothetical protein